MTCDWPILTFPRIGRPLNIAGIMKTSDIIASTGVIILLVAFLLNLYKRLPVTSWIYGTLNFVGAAICCFASYLVSFYPFVVLEGTWAIFGLLALLKTLK
jgi:hypothetical protein